MKIWDRKKHCYIEEKEYAKKQLDFLYQTVPGRILLKCIISRRWFSKIMAERQKTKSSVRKIQPFIEKYQIDLSGCEKKEFDSFEDFFTRKRIYKIDTGAEELIAIADARLMVFPIDSQLMLHIKNSIYSIQELIDKKEIPEAYKNGICLVYRLAMEDYHRYVYPDKGVVGEIRNIPGVLHTVRPVSEQYRVFSRNHRICTILHTNHFSDIIQIEVGALLVGKIHNHQTEMFEKLQEKGYFSYGGSTIIQLFQKDTIQIEKDIITKSKEGIEVKVSIGERIGIAYKEGKKC